MAGGGAGRRDGPHVRTFVSVWWHGRHCEPRQYGKRALPFLLSDARARRSSQFLRQNEPGFKLRDQPRLDLWMRLEEVIDPRRKSVAHGAKLRRAAAVLLF